MSEPAEIAASARAALRRQRLAARRGDQRRAAAARCREGRISRAPEPPHRHAASRSASAASRSTASRSATWTRTCVQQRAPVRPARSRRTSTRGAGCGSSATSGTGKTSLAMLVSKAALEAGRSVAIYSVPRLLADIKETYEDDAERSYTELFSGCARSTCSTSTISAPRSAPSGCSSSSTRSSTSAGRTSARSSSRPTSTLDELREQIGVRTVSRLEEMCGDRRIPIMGRDLRHRAP